MGETKTIIKDKQLLQALRRVINNIKLNTDDVKAIKNVVRDSEFSEDEQQQIQLWSEVIQQIYQRGMADDFLDPKIRELMRNYRVTKITPVQ